MFVCALLNTAAKHNTLVPPSALVLGEVGCREIQQESCVTQLRNCDHNHDYDDKLYGEKMYLLGLC